MEGLDRPIFLYHILYSYI